VAVPDPAGMANRWEHVAGAKIPGCRFLLDGDSPGITEIVLEVQGARHAIRPGALGE
jgi:hypothetical protein